MALQSYVSNELTHFVGRALSNNKDRFQLFLKILTEGWLQASYRQQLGGMTMLSNPGKNLSSNEAIILETLCFCDIPANDLSIHVGKYGPFGIAFSKAFLLHHGASPVFYVAENATNQNLGVGPRTLGARFDELYRDLVTVCSAFEEYVWKQEPQSPLQGYRIVSKHNSQDTPEGQRALGKLHALQGDLERFIFSYLKFFKAELPYEHADNFYMEREWRKRGGLGFTAERVAALYVPFEFRDKLLTLHPEYDGKVRLVEPTH